MGQTTKSLKTLETESRKEKKILENMVGDRISSPTECLVACTGPWVWPNATHQHTHTWKKGGERKFSLGDER